MSAVTSSFLRGGAARCSSSMGPPHPPVAGRATSIPAASLVIPPYHHRPRTGAAGGVSMPRHTGALGLGFQQGRKLRPSGEQSKGGRPGPWSQLWLRPGRQAVRAADPKRTAQGLPSTEAYETEKLQFDEKELAVLVIACFIGIATGWGVSLFNSLIHGIEDVIWAEDLRNGFTVWLRQTPLETTWPKLVLAPVLGGAAVSLLRQSVEGFEQPPNILALPAGERDSRGNLGRALKPLKKSVAKAVAAAITLGTGASLGPEGPSVEIGTSVSRSLSELLVKRRRHKGTLAAAGAAAGISAGFGAPISGVFFAVETVLARDSRSIKGKESGVAVSSLLLASVCAEASSRSNLVGAAPLFRVPDYSLEPAELPLYWLLGALCGLVCTSFSYSSEASNAACRRVQDEGVPMWLLPMCGGLLSGLVSLAYPEIRYQGFDNVDTILQSGNGGAQEYAPTLLLQIVLAKILLTSICRSSGLVGGLYAPSIFLGASVGLGFGSIIGSASMGLIDVSPQAAYGLVGVAAIIAGNCRVPLTAIMLLFELTRDYTILLPTLGAVGISYWVAVALDPTRAQQTTSDSDDAEASDGPETAADSSTAIPSIIGAMELESMLAGDFMAQADTISMRASLGAAIEAIASAQPPVLIVTGKKQRPAGVITVPSLQSAVCAPAELDTEESTIRAAGELARSAEGSEDDLTCSIAPIPLGLSAAYDRSFWLQEDSAPLPTLAGQTGAAIRAAPSVACCGEDDSLAKALRLMGQQRVRYLPVISGGEVVGVLDEESIRNQLKLDIIRSQVEMRQAGSKSPAAASASRAPRKKKVAKNA